MDVKRSFSNSIMKLLKGSIIDNRPWYAPFLKRQISMKIGTYDFAYYG